MTSQTRRAIFTIIAGPNKGDTVSVELGGCRLIGRHLSENETAFIDRDGNRMLDAATSQMLTEQLRERSPQAASTKTENFSVSAFERGPDIIFSDDAISRAHAMIFFDAQGGVGLIDLASTNGSYVNNERITSRLVGDGDTLSLGSSELRVSTR